MDQSVKPKPVARQPDPSEFSRAIGRALRRAARRARETARKLRVAKGDTLYVTETPNGIELTPYQPDFATQMRAAESIMREPRDALRKLAR